MNRTPWDEALMGASTHLASLQRYAAGCQESIAMGMGDGCLPLTEDDLRHMQESLDLFFTEARKAIHHTEQRMMVINDPEVGEEPMYPGQPTYCKKYGHEGRLLNSTCPLCGEIV